MKRYILLIVLSVTVLFPLIAQNEGVSFTIRYYNKKIYYPESEILLKLSIKNNSAETFRFKMANQGVFNLDFEVKTLQNMTLAPSENFIFERNRNQPTLYKEISLDPGVEYSFFADLNDFVTIPRAGTYILMAQFYPELYLSESSGYIQSNRLTLSIRPSTTGIERIEDRIDEETGEILKARPLAPDEVVEYFLRARQRGQWNKFFLYLDVEGLLRRDENREERYLRLSEENRELMKEEFKEDLREQVVDTDIVVVPSEFEILQTSYTPREGTVQVEEKFRYPDYTERKLYTYYLHRQDDIWYIYNYSVRNLGTE